jgi:hypothetical protein
MAYLRIRNEAPPGGWRYFQAETRKWFDGEQGILALAEDVAAHRKYKELARATPDEALEDIHAQVCERLGPEYCQAEKGEDWQPIKRDFTRNLSGEQAVAFTKAFLTFARKGGQFVDQRIAEARADICRHCHLNMKQDGCASCSLLNSMISGAIPTARQFDGVDVCAACGCGLKAKINMTGEVIRASEEGRDLVYPKWCWVPEAINAQI